MVLSVRKDHSRVLRAFRRGRLRGSGSWV